MSKELRFEVEPVKTLPKSLKRARQPIYDDLIKDIMKRGKGYYKVSIPDRKTKSVYVALSKRLKGNKSLKLHIRGSDIYLEKVTGT